MEKNKKIDAVAIKKLTAWLKKNSAVKLAAVLGLSSSNAVQNWIARGDISKKYKERVLKIITKEK